MPIFRSFLPPVPPKKKNPAWRFRAGGLISALYGKGSIQTKTGAAGSRDGNGADAPDESSQKEST
jgi:hypothetical protein